MRSFVAIFVLLFIACNSALTQDTSCGIVWEPPIQLSPDTLNCTGPSIVVQGDTVHITWKDGAGILFPYVRSVDGGKTFESIRDLAPDTTELTSWRHIFSSNDILYGIWVSYPDRKGWLVKSTNGGSSWTEAKLVTDSIGGWLTYAAFGDTILLGTPRDGDYRRLYRSTDGGNSWTATMPKLIGNNPKVSLTSGIAHRVTGWTFDSADVFSEFVIQYRKSTDLGDTWSDSINLSSMSSPYAGDPTIASDPENNNPNVIISWRDAKYGCYSGIGCSIMEKHLNLNDFVWSPEQALTPEPRGFFSKVAIYKSIMAVSWSYDLSIGSTDRYHTFVSVSRDNGLNWCQAKDLTTDTAYATQSAVAVSATAAHVVWEELIGGPLGKFKIFYRRGVFLPASVDEMTTIPVRFELSQNFPNPFNPTTTISFKLRVSGYTSLKIYDLFGREVTTLVSDKLEVGEHRVEWNAENIASGVYYYRLMSYSIRDGVQVKTNKMILIK